MINKLQAFKELAVIKDSKLDKDIQLLLMDNLFNHFIQYGKDLLYISDGQISRIPTKRVFMTIVAMHLKIVFSDIEFRSYDKDNETYIWEINILAIYDMIVSLNAYDLLVYKSDLFLDKQVVEKDDITKTVTVVTNKLHIRKIDKCDKLSKFEYDEIVRDYKEHFPYFDELLKLIIDMRLAKNRKASFLHLRIKSDWGKSFLSGLFQNLEIGLEIDYHNLMNKGANDISPVQVRNSFVLLLDEFNNFSSEMKKLSHDFKFAPKFGMTEKVELYLKILMSAEKSVSFSGGVDDQIVNRVMVMDIDDNKATKLTEREVYLRYGNAKYMSVLERYSYLVLTKRLKEYLAMEKFEAHKRADEEVRKTFELYKMRDVTNLNEDIKSVINEIVRDILESDDMTINPKFREIRSNIIKITAGAYIGKIFIRQPKKTFETILKNTVSESEFKKMKWKLSNLGDITKIVSDHRQRPYKPVATGKTLKGLVIDVQEQTVPIIEEVRQPSTTTKNHLQDIPSDF
jgi:hypothetical protein